MNPTDHLDLLINRAYFDDPATYRTLMAHKAVVVAEREKEEKDDKANRKSRALKLIDDWKRI